MLSIANQQFKNDYSVCLFSIIMNLPAYVCSSIMATLNYNNVFCSMRYNCVLYPKHRMYSLSIAIRTCQEYANWKSARIERMDNGQIDYRVNRQPTMAHLWRTGAW